MEMIAVLISALVAFGAFLGVIVKLTKLQTELVRDIKENTNAISQIADTMKNILSQFEKQGGEIREIQLWQVKIDGEIQRIDGRSQQAFNRSDERKKEIEKINNELQSFSKCRKQCSLFQGANA